MPSPRVAMREVGTLRSIHVAADAGAPTRSVPSVWARVGKGLEGDRYFDAHGTYSDRPGPDREVTLIESEAIESLARDDPAAFATLDPGETRRNLVTRGVALNHLVDREFTIGEVRLRGLRLCEPCAHLQKLTRRPAILSGLVHRGGLRATILTGGVLRVGDAISVDEVPPTEVPRAIAAAPATAPGH
jgi:MOSC domain-containing protein YiiM